MTELDHLKKELCYALIPVSIEMGDVHDDLKLRMDAVIAHLEAELANSIATIKRCNLNMADMERDLYLKLQESESRIAELETLLAIERKGVADESEKF